MMNGKAMRRVQREAAAGFTLVEMVIVIGVIILLAALTLSVSVAVIEGSEIRRTENAIQILTTAIQEWEAIADRQVSYGVDDLPYDQGERYEIKSNLVDEYEATDWLMAIISKPSAVKRILAQIDPELVEEDTFEYDDPDTGATISLATIRIKDAWDTQIVTVFPGRTWVDPPDAVPDRDADGTIRTDLEKRCGIAVNRQVCFISAVLTAHLETWNRTRTKTSIKLRTTSSRTPRAIETSQPHEPRCAFQFDPPFAGRLHPR